MTDSRILNAEARQERVKVLLTRHLSLSEIANAVGVSLRTVKYDVKQIREEAAACLSRSTVFDIAMSVRLTSEARHRELWAIYDQVNAADRSELPPAKAAILKLKILKELARQTTSEVLLLIKLGVVTPAQKAPTEDMKLSTLLDSLPPEVLKRSTTESIEQIVESMRIHCGNAAMAELTGSGRSYLGPPDAETNILATLSEDSSADSGSADVDFGETVAVQETANGSHTKLDVQQARNVDSERAAPRRLSGRPKPLVYKEIDVDKIPPISYNYGNENEKLTSDPDDSDQPRVLDPSMV